MKRSYREVVVKSGGRTYRIPEMWLIGRQRAGRTYQQAVFDWIEQGEAETKKRGNPAGTPDEGPEEHLRNARALEYAVREPLKRAYGSLISRDKGNAQYVAEALEALQALDARVRTALEQLVDKRVDMRLPNSRRRGSVRRGNPSLMVLGANPRVTDAALATWAKIEYTRPDDPDGKDVIRVHEFKDGFEIGWLDDGSVQLSHPRHPLWTEDEIGRA